MFCVRNGKYTKWFHSLNGNIVYIRKKDRQLAERLARKKYVLQKLDGLEYEKKIIESYCRMIKKRLDGKEKLLEKPEYRELLERYFKPDNKALEEWCSESYEQNTYLIERCIHKSISGNMVRSKSELLIDMTLYENKIPFRYECALQLGDTVIFPDFTIKHPHTGEIIYWEHFGCIEKEGYAERAFAKMKQYTMQGIIPDYQLIMTFETPEHPLDIMRVNEIICNRLLN